MKVILTVLLLFVASVLANNSPLQLNIVGGRNAKKGEIPYIVSFQYQPNGNLSAPYRKSCGGSIISPTWILTAGHCVLNRPTKIFKVVAGINQISDKNGQVRKVIKKIIHQGFVEGIKLKLGTVANDIALLQLEKPLLLNALVQTISLPKSGAKFTGDVIGSGWGRTTSTRRRHVQDELKVEVFPLVSNEQCKITLKNYHKLPYKFDDNLNICTGSHTGDSQVCHGDSGGPIAQKGVLVGIVSWGLFPCGSPYSLGVYTNVASFIPFIQANVKDLPGS